MKTIQMFADLQCPYAYVTHATWRRLAPEYQDRVELVHRSLSLEYVNNEPTPKRAIDTELPVLLLDDPDIPYVPWKAAESTWPPTMLPAFEAVHCARLQSTRLADDLAWEIRLAFFRDCRCVSMRHVLLDLAGSVGLDIGQFSSDFDSGVEKHRVIDDARSGWESLHVPGSPTWVLPDGQLVNDFGLAEMSIDDDWRVLLVQRGLHPDERATVMRDIIDGALSRESKWGPSSTMRTMQSGNFKLRLNSAIFPILRIGADEKTANLVGTGFLVGTPPHLVTAKHVIEAQLDEGEVLVFAFVNPNGAITSHKIANWTCSKDFDVAVCPLPGLDNPTSLKLVDGAVESNEDILCYEFSNTRIGPAPEEKTSVHFAPFTHKGNILRRYDNDVLVSVPTPSFDMSFPAIAGASGAPVLRASDFAVAGMVVSNSNLDLMPVQVLRAHDDGKNYEEVRYYLPSGQAIQSRVVIEFLESLQIGVDVVD